MTISPDALPRSSPSTSSPATSAAPPSHLRRLIAERRIPYVKVGSLVRFDSEEIRSWIDANRRAQHPTPSTRTRTP